MAEGSNSSSQFGLQADSQPPSSYRKTPLLTCPPKRNPNRDNHQLRVCEPSFSRPTLPRLALIPKSRGSDHGTGRFGRSCASVSPTLYVSKLRRSCQQVPADVQVVASSSTSPSQADSQAVASSSTSPSQTEPLGEPLSRIPSLEANPAGGSPRSLVSSRQTASAESSRQKKSRDLAYLQESPSLSSAPLGGATAHELDTAARPPSPHSRQPFVGNTRHNKVSRENIGPVPAAAATRMEAPLPSDTPILSSSSADTSKRISPRNARWTRRSERPARVPRGEPAPPLETQGATGRPSFSEAGVRNQRVFSGQQFRWPSPVPGKPSRASVPAVPSPAAPSPAAVNAEPAGSHTERSRRASVVETSRRASILAPKPRAIYRNHAPRLERMSREESLDDSRSDATGSPEPPSAPPADTPALPCSLGSPAPVTNPRRTQSDPGHQSESPTSFLVRPMSDLLPLQRTLHLSFGSSESFAGVTTPFSARAASRAQRSRHSSPSRTQQPLMVWACRPFVPESGVQGQRVAPRFFPPMSPGTWKGVVGNRKRVQGKRRFVTRPLLVYPWEEGFGDVAEMSVGRGTPRRSPVLERQELDEGFCTDVSGEAGRKELEEPPLDLAQSVESLALDAGERPRVKLPTARGSRPSFVQEDQGLQGDLLTGVAENAAEGFPGEEFQQRPPDSMAWEEGRDEEYMDSTFGFEYHAEAEQRVESYHHAEPDHYTNFEQQTQSGLGIELDDRPEPWQSTEREFNMERQHPESEHGQTVDSGTEPDVWYTPRGGSEVLAERQLELGEDHTTRSQTEGRGEDRLVSSSEMIPGQHTPSEHSTPEPRSPSKHRVTPGPHSPPRWSTLPEKGTSPERITVSRRTTPSRKNTPSRKTTPSRKNTPSRKTTPSSTTTPHKQDESPSAGLSAKARGKLPAQPPEQGGPLSLQRPVDPEARRSDID